MREIAAEHDHGWIEEIDRCCQHAADLPPRMADHADRLPVATADQTHHVAAVRGRNASPRQRLGHGAAACHGLEAADVAAATDRVLAIGDLDMTDIASRTLRAAVDLAVRDDPAADSRPSFHE